MSLRNKTIAFIGAGNMGEALIRGLLATQTVTPSQIIAADVRAERRDFLTRTFGVRAANDNPRAAADADVVLLAVKPQQISEVLAAMKSQITDRKLIVTIAAGVTTSRVEGELGGHARVIRAMPNMPALVGAGAAVLAKGRHASADDLATAEAILGAVGLTARVDEDLLDAVTALSGSGPAYIFLVVEAMIRAGVTAGLDEALAKRLAIQTLYGAAKLLVESREEPQSLRQKVTSPGGTTEAALKVMSERKLMEIFADAMNAAACRSRELSAG